MFEVFKRIEMGEPRSFLAAIDGVSKELRSGSSELGKRILLAISEEVGANPKRAIELLGS